MKTKPFSHAEAADAFGYSPMLFEQGIRQEVALLRSGRDGLKHLMAVVLLAAAFSWLFLRALIPQLAPPIARSAQCAQLPPPANPAWWWALPLSQ